jgi:hypothetical protein
MSAADDIDPCPGDTEAIPAADVATSAAAAAAAAADAGASGAAAATATTPAERRKALRENQNYFSEKLSDLIRYIGFGLVAASFSLLSRSTTFSQSLSDRVDSLLATAALLGCLVIVADAFQLLGGWWSNSLAANNAPAEYKLVGFAKVVRAFQNFLFYAKQVLAAAGCALLIVAIANGISIQALAS